MGKISVYNKIVIKNLERKEKIETKRLIFTRITI